MTLQLPPREAGADTGHEAKPPEVLFEEARRRRRRRWGAGGAVATAAGVAAVLLFGTAGGGGGGGGATLTGHPAGQGSGAGSGHSSEGRLLAGAPVTERFYTGPGASCPLAPHSRYLPAWSGCVSTMVADVSGNGQKDLVITYSRLSHVSLRGLPARSLDRSQDRRRYAAEQAMIRVVSPSGQMATAAIRYTTPPASRLAGKLQKADAAALISTSHISDEPGKQMVLQINQISSGSNAVVYSLYRGHLVSSGALLGYGGDGGSQAGFQCVAGSPPRLIQRDYELSHGLRASGESVHIYGWWKVTTTTYAWHGPRLVAGTAVTVKRRMVPNDTAGSGCTKGIT
jgi:hypothetical protein